MAFMCGLDEDRRFSVFPELFEGLRDGNGNLAQEIWAAIVGNHVQLLPPDSALVETHNRLGQISRNTDWRAGAKKRTDVLRKVDGLLPIDCRRHGKKIRCTLSADFVIAGLFTPPQDIVVVAMGQIVQVWPVAQWRAVATISDLESLAESLSDLTEVEP